MAIFLVCFQFCPTKQFMAFTQMVFCFIQQSSSWLSPRWFQFYPNKQFMAIYLDGFSFIQPSSPWLSSRWFQFYPTKQSMAITQMVLVLSNQVVHGYHLDSFQFYPTKQCMAITQMVLVLYNQAVHGSHLDGFSFIQLSSPWLSPRWFLVHIPPPLSPRLITGAEHAFIIPDSCHYAPLRTTSINCRRTSKCRQNRRMLY